MFHEVAITGQIDLAEMLLMRGGESTQDDSGKTPLAHAVDSKREAMAAWLRAHGGTITFDSFDSFGTFEPF